MIPDTSFRRDGDTALWVLPGLPATDELQARPDPPETLFLNRPCDTCDGHGCVIWVDDPCMVCDGTGRHTFDIDVVETWYPFNGPAGIDCTDTFRVHVIDVLPICDEVESYPCVVENHITYTDGKSATVLDHATHERIILPPDAAPGKWLVRLAVHK